MKTFNFDNKPTFAELWDLCVYNLLYNESAYCDEIDNLFNKIGITKNSKVIDVSAGGGFPAISLSKKGYQIDCTDGFIDEVELFNDRAKQKEAAVRCAEVMWLNLPKQFDSNTYDFMFCRGNSFIYALGGWNNLVSIDSNAAIKKYADTAKVFFDLLKPGGCLYIDKFMDNEHTHKEIVAKIKIKKEEEKELIFWTERFPEEKIRRASMIIKDSNGEEKGVPNISYDLTFEELKSILFSVGFTSVEELKLSSENNFGVLLARK